MYSVLPTDRASSLVDTLVSMTTPLSTQVSDCSMWIVCAPLRVELALIMAAHQWPSWSPSVGSAFSPVMSRLQLASAKYAWYDCARKPTWVAACAGGVSPVTSKDATTATATAPPKLAARRPRA